MNDKERTKAFNAERKKQLKRDIAIQNDTLGEINRLLNVAKKDINQTLSNSPSEWEAWYLPQLQKSVDESLKDFSTQASQKMGQGADSAFAAGQDLVDEPLNSAQFAIQSQLPMLDNKQLLNMKYFMTDRMKDVGSKLTNKINSELGLVVIGAQTPYDARQKIAKLFEKDGERRALAIVRTEVGRVYAMAGQQRMDQAKTILPGLKKQWRRSGKLHSRLHHDAADGQIKEVDEPFKLSSPRGTVSLMYPGDPQAPVAEVIHCGCESLPYMEHWKMKNPGKKPFTQDEIDGDANKRLLAGANDPMNKLVQASTSNWMANKPQTQWHNRAFVKAPVLLQTAIKKHDSQLKAVTYDVKYGPHFNPLKSTINMSNLKRNNRKNRGTWQHEYGHFLDAQYGRGKQKGRNRSQQADFLEALDNDKKHFLVTSGMGRKSKKQQDILANNAILNNEIIDNLSQMDKKQRRDWINQAGNDIGLSYGDLVGAMKADGFYDLATQNRDIRAAQLLEAIKRHDARSFLYYFNGLDRPNIRAVIRDTYNKGIAGKFSYLIGSMTKNKLGGTGLNGIGGQSDAYYRTPGIHATETFANLTTLTAQDSVFWGAVLESFTPQLNRVYRGVLENE